MKNNKFFKAMQKKLDEMTYGEFHEASQRDGGKYAAFSAWREGNSAKLDFPLLTYSLYEDEISDFLKTLEKVGFKKFGFFSRGGDAVINIAEFLKAGWKLTGTFRFDAGLHKTVMFDCLIFESRDYA